MVSMRVRGVARDVLSRAHRSSASIGNLSMWPRGILAQYNHARNLHHTIQKFGSVTIKPDSAGLISHDFIIDEEELEGYNAEHWYDVRLGQVFNQRYQVIGKLGHGSRSTVWLCRDLRAEPTADMRTAVLLFAATAVLAVTVQAGNPSLSTPGSNAVTKCLKGKLKNGKCVSKLRVRQVGSDEWLEIPELQIRSGTQRSRSPSAM